VKILFKSLFELGVLNELPVLKEEDLSSDLGYSIKYDVFITYIHWRDRWDVRGQWFVCWLTCPERSVKMNKEDKDNLSNSIITITKSYEHYTSNKIQTND